MFTTNPFAGISDFAPALMQGYLVVMALAVIVGTLFDIVHKGSAKYFFDNMRPSKDKGREVGGGEKISIAVQTLAVDVLASGEFCNAKRRVAHLLGMYGFTAVRRRARLGRVLQPATPDRAPARHVRLRPLRRRHRGHGVLLPDAGDADAGDLAAAVVDRRADGAASAATGSGSSSASTSPPKATRRSASCAPTSSSCRCSRA